MKCSPFYFSSLIPKQEGKVQIDVTPEVRNFIEDLYVAADQDFFSTVSNKRNTITFSVKNESDHVIRFRPIFYTDPAIAENYIDRYNCSCGKEYKLAAGESAKMQIDFSLQEKVLENNQERYKNGSTLKIGFRTKPF